MITPPHRTEESRPDQVTRIGLRRTTRRRLLAGVAATGGAILAGCLGDDDDGDVEPADPVDLTGRYCETCGMVIDDHYGPAGQVFYADGEPEDRDGPAAFDSLGCLLSHHEEAEAQGWVKRTTFVTDYSSVEYDLAERDGKIYVTTHVDPGAFADAQDCQFVTDSAVEGAMGEAAIPFSDGGDADAFADEHGGSVRSWSDLR